MLVGRSVEHVVGTELLENRLHPLLFADVRHDGVYLRFRPLFLHQQANVVLRRFGLVYQHHFGRFERGDLPHHLAADAARRTRNQDALPREHLRDFI